MSAAGLRLAVVLSAAVLAGCKPPTLHVRHQVSGGLKVPVHTAMLAVEPMVVRSGPADGYGLQAARLLVRELERQTPWEVALSPAADQGAQQGRAADQPRQPPPRPPDLLMSGRLYIHVRDEATTQPVRPFEPSGRGGPEMAQPALVRLVAVRQEVVVTDGRGSVLGTLQAEDLHDSRHGRPAAGLWGLGRRDEPSAVRPPDEVIPQVLASLATTLAGMIAPEVIQVDIPLRDTPHPTGRKGLEAARRGRLTEARSLLEQALAGAPDQPALAFDLAAAEEALGLFDRALSHYLLALNLANGGDYEARGGADRMRRMLSYEASP